MSIEALVVWIIVGALAGWLASIVVGTNRSQGLLADIIVGVIGGLLGGFLLTAIGIPGLVTGINLGSIAVAVSSGKLQAEPFEYLQKCIGMEC